MVQDLIKLIEGEKSLTVRPTGPHQGSQNSLIVSNLATATQAHLTRTLGTSTPISLHREENGGHTMRHMSTNRKIMDWRLSVRKKWLVVGDSNLARILTFNNDQLQVDSYPGATFRHMEAVLNKTPMPTKVQHAVLSLGPHAER